MSEADYLRASARILGILEDEDLLKTLGNASESSRKSMLMSFIEERFPASHAENMKNAVSARLDNSFKANYKGPDGYVRNWKNKTLNEVLDNYRQETVRKIEFEEAKTISEAKKLEVTRRQVAESEIEAYDQKKAEWEGKVKAAETGKDKRILKEKEKIDLKVIYNKLSPTARIKLEGY